MGFDAAIFDLRLDIVGGAIAANTEYVVGAGLHFEVVDPFFEIFVFCFEGCDLFGEPF